MSADLAVTRRRKMLAFLVEQGGSAGLADANHYSETKLLAAHQAFSAIMEGLVDGGYATWDGTTFVVTAAGREEAALAPKSRARKAAKDAVPAAEQVPGAEGEPSSATPPPVPANEVVAAAPVAPETPVGAEEPASDVAHDHGHSHDHGGAHDHGHSHDHGGDRVRDDAPPSRPVPPRPRPTVEAPRKGLRTRALGLIRRLFSK